MALLAKKPRIIPAVCAIVTGLTGPAILPSCAQTASGFVTAPPATVSDGAVVHLEYTMRDDSGAVLHASPAREPFVFTQGEHEVIASLERAVDGMGVGEEKRVTIAPEDAYGPVNPDAGAEVPRDAIPSEAQHGGEQIVARGPDGATRLVRVKEHTVVLDLNHPFAGMTLHFALRVVGIDHPTPR